MENTTLYLLPSLSAIAIKLLIVWYGRKSICLENVCIWIFFLSLFMINIIEVISFVFVGVTDQRITLSFLSVYYIFAIAASFSYLLVCLNIAALLVRSIKIALLLGFVLGLVTLFIPGAALEGTQHIGYSITRVPGPFYWVVQVLLVCPWVLGPFLLRFSLRSQLSWINRRRALSLLIGSLPTAVSVVAVVVLMQTGNQINATIIVSLSLNFLLGVMVYTEHEDRVFNFLSNIPNTEENGLVKQAMLAITGIEKHSLPALVHQFEKVLISDSLKSNKANKTKAAKSLGISKTTLNRKLLSS